MFNNFDLSDALHGDCVQNQFGGERGVGQILLKYSVKNLENGNNRMK